MLFGVQQYRLIRSVQLEFCQTIVFTITAKMKRKAPPSSKIGTDAKKAKTQVNAKRCQVLISNSDPSALDQKGVLYWMSRDQRVIGTNQP